MRVNADAACEGATPSISRRELTPWCVLLAMLPLVAWLLSGCATGLQPKPARSATVADGVEVNWSDAASLGDALSLARAGGKQVLLVFTGSFSTAARQMGKVVLNDARVTSLIAEHTVALRADVIERAAWARQFHVRLLPTVILLDADGAEIMRWAGEQNADSFADVLQSVAGGANAPVERGKRDAKQTPKTRLERARRVATEGNYQLALAEYRTILDESFSGDSAGRWKSLGKRGQSVTFGQVISAIGQLGAAYSPARDTLDELQGAERVALLATAGRDQGARFVAVCRANDGGLTLLETFRALPPGAGRDVLADDAFAMLLAQRAYAEAAEIVPLNRVLERIEKNSDLPLAGRGALIVLMPPLAGFGIHSVREQMLERNVRYFEVYAGARRDAEAGDIAQAILRRRRTNSAAAALTRAALRARPEDGAALINALGIRALTEGQRD